MTLKAMPEGSAELRLLAANDREACRAQLAANRDAARALFRERSDEQLLWRPAPDVWSIVDNMLHLNTTGRVYLAAVDRAIAEGRRRGQIGAGPFRHPWFSRWFVGSLEPPAKRRFRAPRIFVPPPPGPPQAALDDFEALGQEIGARLDASRGLDLGRVRVVSPVVPLIRSSLGMAFSLFATHERRHLYQAQGVTTLPDFPRGV